MLQKSFVYALAGLMACCHVAAAQGAGGPSGSRTKEAAIQELMEISGAKGMAMQMMNGMLPSLKQMVPDVPQSFWDDFMAEIDPDQLEKMVVPIYDKYFSQEEIEELIRINKTPLGQKVLHAMPLILKESMEAGQKWGEETAKRAIDKARERAAKAKT